MSRLLLGLGLLALSVFSVNVPFVHAADSALPHLPFPMPAADYPQEALVANQEGAVVLRATIGLDAKMTNITVIESSGYPILDDAAVLVLRNAQLSQPPMTPDGQPTSADVLVDANWVLPLESAEEYFPEAFFGDIPESVTDVTYPMENSEANAGRIRARDFPVSALHRDRSGIAGLYLHILDNGTVGDVRLASSAGDASLDEASVEVLRRFTFSRPMLNGDPTSMWIPFEFFWSAGNIYSPRRFSPCFEIALVDPYERRSDRRRREAPQDTPASDTWLLYGQDGHVHAGLLLTEGGWKEIAPPLLSAIMHSPPPRWTKTGLKRVGYIRVSNDA